MSGEDEIYRILGELNGRVSRLENQYASPAKPCEFVTTATGETGINTGRQRYRVVCLTHRSLVHPATTGPIQIINRHLRDPGCDHGPMTDVDY